MTTRALYPSVLSFGLWAFGPNGAKNSIKIATDSGYPGIHAAPLTGWRAADWNNYDHGIGTYQRRWGDKPLDKIVFGGQLCHIPGAIMTVTNAQFGPRVSVEIHPGLSTDLQYYMSLALGGYKFGLDTYHWLYKDRAGRSMRDRKELLIELAARDAINLIHVHPSNAELAEFLQGYGRTIYFLQQLQEVLPGVPAIIEIFPRVTLGFQGYINLFIQIREVCEVHLG